MNAPSDVSGGQARLRLHTVRDVVPLAEPSGTDPGPPCPEALADAVFGQPSPRAPAGDTLRTYAVIDAAKVTNLPEMLAASGLTHKCLFTGQALADLGDVAPWLVDLDPQAPFTRYLFTRGTAPWSLWDVEASILMRSASDFEGVWSHLRKFTRVQDASGSWFYFRFYEPMALAPLLTSWAETPDRVAKFCGLGADGSLSHILCIDPKGGRALVAKPEGVGGRPIRNAPFQLTEQDRQILSRWRMRAFDLALLDEVIETYPALAKADRRETSAWLGRVIAAAEHGGFTLEGAITNFAHAAYLLAANPMEHGDTAHIMGDATLHQNDKAKLARRAAEAYVKARGGS